MNFIKKHKKGITLNIKITPNAAQNKIKKWEKADTQLKMEVKAAPEKGKANKEVIKLLSKQLKTPQNKLEILTGSTTKTKIILLAGAKEEDVINKLKSDMETE